VLINSTGQRRFFRGDSSTEDVDMSNGEQRNKAGKYLTFSLGQEQFGLEILKVREIIGLMEITEVPRTPHDIRGVINLRGQVIPVLDIRSRFGMMSSESTDQTCIIVVEVRRNGQTISTGILVDQVQEVQDIAAAAIEEPPDFGSGVDSGYILGMAKIGSSIKILLDIDKVLCGVSLSGF
jgi:purine-binding chemotaxis protein CheW